MKNTIIKSILALFMAFIALPMMGQDYMIVFFKDGNCRKFYLKDVTEILTSNVDANGITHSGNNYQHVRTDQIDFVYNLVDVDSVVFSKYNEEQAETSFVDAIPQVISSISECTTIADAEQQIGAIKAISGVEDAWSDGHKLYVKIDEGEVFSFHFSHFSYQKMGNMAISQIISMLSPMKSIIKTDGTPLKVAIVNQQDKDEDRDYSNLFNALTEQFALCGIKVDYLPTPTVDFFFNNSDDPDNLHFYDYDIILLSTHGGYGDILYYKEREYWFDEVYSGAKGHEITTSEDILSLPSKSEEAKDYPKNWWKKKYQEFRKWRNCLVFNYATDQHINFTLNHEIRDGEWCWMLHPTLTEFFFKDIAEGKFKNPNAIFYNAACESLKGDNGNPSYTFADILFQERDLGVYLGYTEENFSGQTGGYYLLSNMASGLSIEKSFDNLPDWCKIESVENCINHPDDFTEDALKSIKEDGTQNAELKLLSKDEHKKTDFFLFPTITIEVDEKQINEQFANSNFVTIEGVTTFAYAIPETGFKIGQDPHMLTKDITTKDLFVHSGNGNCLFKANLSDSDLTPGNTYYYCAYTYDGLNYNYGDSCSFTLYNPPILSENTITLMVGNTGNIRISSGSGEYEAISSNPEVATATVSKLHESYAILLINTMKSGIATITVKDIKSGHSAKIDVTVCDHLSFAIDGTVDLKVGESTTVDITSGSGTYSIEEIKPAGVVTASVSENHISIEALKAGTATITVKDDKSGEKVPIEVKVQVKDIPAEAIDLGLPSGILWASYNVGATTPEEYGSYFAWGEIEDKDVYYWTTYSHCDGVSNSCHDIGADISGTRFDVAHMRWEGDWRMPTAEEFKELVYKCDYQVTTQNGVYGFKFTGPNGNSIFFPAAGYRFNTGINKAGSSGEYWSSTVRENKNYAYDTSMSADYVYWDCYINRFAGLPVRPVKRAEPALEDLVLSTTSPISLKAGETYTVQIISGNGVYSIFDNTAPNVVTASISENNVIIEALTPGTATITVKDDKSGKKAPIEVTVTESTAPVTSLTCPDDHHPHMIDLGLPSGTKWACCNVGADTPEGFGDYFAWGETEEKSEYSRETYRYCNFTNRRWHWENLGSDIAGTDYDAATANWGAPWRMPTLEQIDELLNDCTVEKTTQNEVNGLKFVGPSGRSIFLPDAGYKLDEDLSWHRAESGIWSSTYSGRADEFATFLGFESARYYDSRCKGRSVRPVQ